MDAPPAQPQSPSATSTGIQYRSGNPLARVAQTGYTAFQAKNNNRLKIVRKALLSALPDDPGGHGKWAMRRILTVFLRGASSLDDGSMEQAAYLLELEYLERTGRPTEFKGFPDGDTVYQRLRNVLPFDGLNDELHALLSGSVMFAVQNTNHITRGGQDLAFDVHKEPIYPRKKEHPRKHHDWPSFSQEEKEILARDDYRRDAIGCKDFRGTKQCLANATLQVVGPHRYTLSHVNMRDVGNSFSKAMDDCLVRAESLGLRFRALFCDREGSNPSTVRIAQKYADRDFIKYYTLAAKRDEAVKRALKSVEWLDIPGKVGWHWFKIPSFPLAEDLKPTLVGVRRLEEVRDPKIPGGVRGEYKTFLFWTNQEISANGVYEKSEEYRGRWGIETGYRQVEYGFPSTQTTSRRIQRFLFVVRLVLLNVQSALEEPALRIGLAEFPVNRKVTLARVRLFLWRALDDWVWGVEDSRATPVLVASG